MGRKCKYKILVYHFGAVTNEFYPQNVEEAYKLYHILSESSQQYTELWVDGEPLTIAGAERYFKELRDEKNNGRREASARGGKRGKRE